jgi:hypothetical protein
MVKRVGAVLLVVLAVISVLSLVVMGLWNELVPQLFHGPRIGFWQAAGLLVLSRILVGSLRGRGGPARWHHRRWKERLESMTPEERERLRERLGRCDWRATTDVTAPRQS